jgi:hypothetical protein
MGSSACNDGKQSKEAIASHMLNYLIEFWENLMARTSGPLQLRFYFSPAICIIYAARAAIRDAKKHLPPYLFRMLATSKQRKAIAMEGWKDIGKVFMLAVVIDIAYQFVMIFAFDTTVKFNLPESFIVSLFLTILPYILVRGPLNRIIGKYYIRKKVRRPDTSGEGAHHN